MKELHISKDFTIEDIHMVREYNYERRKDMTFEERKADISKGANAMMELIEQSRKESVLTKAL